MITLKRITSLSTTVSIISILIVMFLSVNGTVISLKTSRLVSLQVERHRFKDRREDLLECNKGGKGEAYLKKLVRNFRGRLLRSSRRWMKIITSEAMYI
jgi:hypothetical protein